MIAALYIDSRRGPYAGRPDVDAWGMERDATLYAGPWPVVAHPPCGHWGRYTHRAHDDGHTGPVAVEQVRRWGGVLEHPRDSRLWAFCGLPRPGELPDQWGGRSIEVDQCDWGHVARKRTWLYVVGCLVPPMPPHVEIDRRHYRRKASGRWSSPLERMAKSQRHLTPPAFAAWLVALAASCRPAD